MKKSLILWVIFLCGLSVNADVVEVETVGDMKNFWEHNGKYEQKVLDVGTKIINANKLDKRIPIQLNRNRNIINACSYYQHKTIVIYYGILPYFDNDDELAYVLSHEMAHSLDAYGGFFKWVHMSFNSKQYEYKADLIGIDMMTRAGYNPIAAITCANKWMPEDYWGFGILASHPKTSKRLFEMYKYIYVKYPWALKTDMVHNVNFENFIYASKKDVNEFMQYQKQRSLKQNSEDL